MSHPNLPKPRALGLVLQVSKTDVQWPAQKLDPLYEEVEHQALDIDMPQVLPDVG